MNLIRILILIFCLFKISYQRCGVNHEFLQKRKSGIVDVLNGKSDRFLQSASWTPIKIYVDYSTVNSQLSSDVTKLKNLKTVMDIVSSAYSKLLSVKSTNQKLIILDCDSGETNFKLTIDPKISSEGVDADLILFPYMIPNADTNAEIKNVQAYATSCQKSKQNNRPVAGFIGFGNILDFSKENALYYISLLVLHEINHILAFNEEYFNNNFVDANGQNLPLSSVTKIMTVNGIERKLLITPKVVQAAKEYFNCDNVIGLELENQGGSGSAGSHWEARTILGEFMNAQDYPETVISKMSLALFEDSGWYKVNYYDAGLYKYGKNQGCNFLNTKCIVNDMTSFPNEFNPTTGQGSMCYGSRSGKGFNSLTNNPQDLTDIYVYFSDRTLGGYSYADFCPVANDDNIDQSFYFQRSCWMGNPEYTESNQGETIGPDSYCFYSTVSKSTNTVTNPNAVCYKTSQCDSNSKTYVVTAGSSTASCSEGKTVTFDNYVGDLKCLPFDFVCTKSKPCNDVFDCIQKEVTSIEENKSNGSSSTDSSNSSVTTKASNYLTFSCVLGTLFYLLVN